MHHSCQTGDSPESRSEYPVTPEPIRDELAAACAQPPCLMGAGTFIAVGHVAFSSCAVQSACCAADMKLAAFGGLHNNCNSTQIQQKQHGFHSRQCSCRRIRHSLSHRPEAQPPGAQRQSIQNPAAPVATDGLDDMVLLSDDDEAGPAAPAAALPFPDTSMPASQVQSIH